MLQCWGQATAPQSFAKNTIPQFTSCTPVLNEGPFSGLSYVADNATAKQPLATIGSASPPRAWAEFAQHLEAVGWSRSFWTAPSGTPPRWSRRIARRGTDSRAAGGTAAACVGCRSRRAGRPARGDTVQALHRPSGDRGDLPNCRSFDCSTPVATTADAWRPPLQRPRRWSPLPTAAFSGALDGRGLPLNQTATLALVAADHDTLINGVDIGGNSLRSGELRPIIGTRRRAGRLFLASVGLMEKIRDLTRPRRHFGYIRERRHGAGACRRVSQRLGAQPIFLVDHYPGLWWLSVPPGRPARRMQRTASLSPGRNTPNETASASRRRGNWRRTSTWATV